MTQEAAEGIVEENPSVLLVFHKYGIEDRVDHSMQRGLGAARVFFKRAAFAGPAQNHRRSCDRARVVENGKSHHGDAHPRAVCAKGRGLTPPGHATLEL